MFLGVIIIIITINCFQEEKHNCSQNDSLVILQLPVRSPLLFICHTAPN